MNSSKAERNTHAERTKKRAEERIEIRTQTGPFAMVPAWLYDAVSEKAQSLYGRLWLRANWSTGVEEGLTRAEIADLMGWSVDTVDRFTKELEKAGALVVERRASKIPGEHRNLPNVYVLVQAKPEEVAADLRLLQDAQAAGLRLQKPQICGPYTETLRDVVIPPASQSEECDQSPSEDSSIREADPSSKKGTKKERAPKRSAMANEIAHSLCESDDYLLDLTRSGKLPFMAIRSTVLALLVEGWQGDRIDWAFRQHRGFSCSALRDLILEADATTRAPLKSRPASTEPENAKRRPASVESQARSMAASCFLAGMTHDEFERSLLSLDEASQSIARDEWRSRVSSAA